MPGAASQGLVCIREASCFNQSDEQEGRWAAAREDGTGQERSETGKTGRINSYHPSLDRMTLCLSFIMSFRVLESDRILEEK